MQRIKYLLVISVLALGMTGCANNAQTGGLLGGAAGAAGGAIIGHQSDHAAEGALLGGALGGAGGYAAGNEMDKADHNQQHRRRQPDRRRHQPHRSSAPSNPGVRGNYYEGRGRHLQDRQQAMERDAYNRGRRGY